MKPLPLVAALIAIALLGGSGAIAQETTPEPQAPAAPPQLRIATVDMQELFKQYHRTIEVQKQINADRARVQKETNERISRVKQVQEQIQRESRGIQTGAPPQAPPPKADTIAVMRIGENGSVRLEELASNELGSIELAFGLTPLVSDDLQDW